MVTQSTSPQTSPKKKKKKKKSGRYLNCGVVMTTKQPTNQSELQLYRVLQRANLLQYYDTFITQGGDDVQQLCEAGEEEFLEIMALVGMASKPLHVRRLQKSLQEWVANPGTETPLFQQPLAALTPPPAPPGSIVASVHGAIAGAVAYAAQTTNVITAPTWNPHPITTLSNSPSPPAVGSNSVTEYAPSPSPSAGGIDTPKNSPSPSNGSGVKRDSNSPIITPVLSESQIQAIADAAEKLTKSLPPFLPKPMNTKKQISKEIEDLMTMSPDHPDRMDLLRRYAAIYGRFDSKRKNVKPMSLHEISVNEAAAQLCAHVSTLLTRREELFPLARAVVRDSGYQYAKGHSRNKPFPYSRAQGDLQDQQPYKRARLERLLNNSKTIKAELDRIHKEERLTEIHATLAQLSSKQEDLQARIQEVQKSEAQGFSKTSEENSSTQSLQVELDALVEHHMLLVSEQNEIVQWLTTDSRNKPFPFPRAQGDLQDQQPYKRARIEHLLNNSKTIKAELDKIHKEERLAEIHATLAHLSSKQEDLQARIQEMKKAEAQGGYTINSEENSSTQSLQVELDALVEHHMLLVSEQNEIVQQLSVISRYRAGKKGSQGTNSGDDETDSSNLPSGCSSPRNGTADGDDLDFYKMKSKLFQDDKGENKGQLQQTLFDEGLRIAQQYGMADFAEELKELKEGNEDSNHSQENGDDLVDEQAEWNREVDKDLHKAQSSPAHKAEQNTQVPVETS